ncbi:MAG: septum formation initiator family protein [Bacteroides sp.]|jgi:cell division protein FtsB|nr:septum formation initiator family protein [Bacteroides sp.]
MKLNLPSFLKNKYIIALVVMVVWLAFFDKNNLIQQWRMRKQLIELRRDKNYYSEEIERDSTSIRELKENPEALEKYARENYLMKKEDEEIFIIAED